MRQRILAGVLAFVAGCQTGGFIAPEGRVWSPEAEALAGRRAASSLERQYGGTVADGAALGRLTALARRLSASRPELACSWHCHILATDHVNAFSLPGGLIYVSRGLYERLGPDDDMLAAVLAHEMAHVVSRDSLKPVPATPEEILAREIRADGHAVEYLRAAGCCPRSLVRLLRLVDDVQPGGWSDMRVTCANRRIQSLARQPAETLAVR